MSQRSVSGRRKASCGRLSLLLASNSVAALLVGGGTQPAFAGCSVTQSGGSVLSVSNSSPAGSCIAVDSNAVVTGNVSNNGVLTANGGVQPSANGITIANSTVGGAVTNSGTITARIDGIAVLNFANVSGGINNSGSIKGASGILVSVASTFAGGISNSGTISLGGIGVNNVGGFSGAISNGGTIAAPQGYGIAFDGVSSFSGGISNSGTISSTLDPGIFVSDVLTFVGGIDNSGRISADSTGISITAVTTFTGGISNGGMISGVVGIAVTNAGAVGVYDAGFIAGSGGTAVDLSRTGPGNTFTLGTTASFGAGTESVIGSGNDTFQLGGSDPVPGNFNLSNIGTQYIGFTTFNVTSATWVATGTGNQNWSIFNGATLQLGNGGSGANAGAIIGNVADNGTFAIDRADTYTYAGNISGSGSLVQMGVGTTVLTGTNNYSGGTTITAGTLALSGKGSIASSSGVADNGKVDISGLTNGGASIASLSGSGTVALGANTLTLTSARGTFSGAIGGTGGLTLTEGTETLTGTNTYTGMTTIDSGTLSLGSDGPLILPFGSGPGSIAASSGVIDNGTLDISAEAPFGSSIASLSGNGTVVLGLNTLTLSNANGAFSGMINGLGGLRLVAGVETLSGANTYVGPTFIVGGRLALSGAGSIAMSSGVTDNGTFDISGLSNGHTSIRGLSGSGTVALGVNTLQLLSGVDGGIFSGVISGTGGLLLMGNEALTGNNTYTGPTSIRGPSTLEVDGSIASSNVTVGSGATLTGTGTVDPNTVTVLPFASFSPGAVGIPGTSMTITGNLAIQSGALYLVYLDPSTSTFANVTGTAALAGTVNATFATGTYISKVYTILNAGSINGTFTALTTNNLPSNFTASLAYDSAHAYLDLTLNFNPAPVFTPLNVNESNVANTLINYFNNTGSIPMTFGILAPSGLTQIDGEDATGAEHGAIELTNEFLSLMLDPFVYGRGGAASGGGALGFAPDRDKSFPSDVASAYAGILKAPPKPATAFDQHWTVWGASFGGSGTFKGDPTTGSNNVTASTYGFAAGADYRGAPDTVLGFALAGAGTNWRLANALGTGRSDAFQAGVFGTKYFGPAYIGAALAFTDNWITTNRAALGDQLTASFQGQSYGVRVESGYRYVVAPAAGVTPYTAIQAQDFHAPTYSETDLTGGGFGLTYNATTAADTRAELGARFDALTDWGAIPVQLRARLAWAHDWVSNSALDASFQALPGTSFVVDGAAVPHDSALASVGAEMLLTSRWTLLGKFDGEFASSAQIYAGSGTLRYVW